MLMVEKNQCRKAWFFLLFLGSLLLRFYIKKDKLKLINNSNEVSRSTNWSYDVFLSRNKIQKGKYFRSVNQSFFINFLCYDNYSVDCVFESFRLQYSVFRMQCKATSNCKKNLAISLVLSIKHIGLYNID